MAFYKGKTFRVKVDGKTIMHEISFEFGIETEFQELATKDKEHDVNPGKQTYPISYNGLVENSAGNAQEDILSMTTWAVAKSSKPFEIGDAETGHLNITGNAYMKTINITGENDQVLTYNATLEVTDITLGTTA